jgi:hypothetical protein
VVDRFLRMSETSRFRILGSSCQRDRCRLGEAHAIVRKAIEVLGRTVGRLRLID